MELATGVRRICLDISTLRVYGFDMSIRSIDRTTVRMNGTLKQRLEELARREGKTFTDLLHEAGWELVRRRESSVVGADFELPVVKVAAGVSMDVEQIKRRLGELDDEYDRRQSRIAMGLEP